MEVVETNDFAITKSKSKYLGYRSSPAVHLTSMHEALGSIHSKIYTHTHNLNTSSSIISSLSYSDVYIPVLVLLLNQKEFCSVITNKLYAYL